MVALYAPVLGVGAVALVAERPDAAGKAEVAVAAGAAAELVGCAVTATWLPVPVCG